MADEKKKLTRSKNDRWLAGVCGGIAEYFNVDAVLIRVLFILFSFAVGGGLIIYIILWIVMPEGSAESEAADLADEWKAEEAEPLIDLPKEVVEEEEPGVEDAES